LEQIWVIVWFAAGIVALVTGIMWGARSEVSFALDIIALKALPVLILGGFTSIPGAIVGGLIIGLGEKLTEFYWGPLVGGGTDAWFAYVIALVFLMFRPQGRFAIGVILLIAYVAIPLTRNDFLINAIMTPFLIFTLAAIGLNILTGYTGLLSLGTGAFMGVGAYACYKLTTYFPNVNILIWIIASGFVSAAVGAIFGLPAVRIKGFY